MAPRGRSRKPRLSRMDAAVDAMVPLGFPEDLVRKTVKTLLKEYGGDEGWPFIEADAYSVLLETILSDQQEGNSQEECGEGGMDDPSQGERAGDYAGLPTAENSGGVVEAVCSEIINTASETRDTEDKDYPPHLQAENGKGWKDIGLDQTCGEMGMVSAAVYADGCSRGAVHLHNTPFYSPPPVISSPPPIDYVPTRRRKPCYGWISDEEEEDFIYLTPALRLTPATPSGHLENLNGETGKQTKRKSRWDIAPEDT